MAGDAAIGAIAWPALAPEIAATSPAAVAWPDYPSWPALAHANRAALAASALDIAGVALGDLRREARGEAMAAAAAYTRALGIEVAPGSADLLVCTGHQPLLMHPGIWVKYLAMARLVPPGGLGLSLIVDSDAVDEVAADVPGANGRLHRRRVALAAGGPDTPAEVMPAPSAAAWQMFVAAVDAQIATIPDPGVAAGWTRARELPPPPTTAGLAGAVTVLRRALEGPRPYLELPISTASATPAFRRFALAVLREPRRFAEIHNACLASYRAHYGVRTTAQPFPDLAIGKERVELPFWYVDGGRRWPLAADVARGTLTAGGREVSPIPEAADDAAFVRLPIRPRALVLTAFARLVLSDLFIHGVGGGRYDRATDAIVRAFFGIAPPAYAVTTATLFLPFAAGAQRAAERQRLERALLDLQHNPDRHLPQDAGPHQALVGEKWSLIGRLEQGGLTRRERRSATWRIREINQILQVAVADRVAAVQEALRQFDRRDDAAEVAEYRGYPFLLHPVEAIDALVDGLAGGAAGTAAEVGR